MHFLPNRRPLGFELKPDMLVLAFVTGVCVLTAVLVSIVPAWSVLRTDLISVMSRQSGTVSGPRVGRALVIFQVAIATALVAGGLALVRTVEVMRAQDPGFRRSKLVVMTLNPRMAGIKSEGVPQIFKDIEQRAALLPGVEAVSLAEKAPMRGIGLKGTVLPAGSRVTRTDSLNVSLNNVSIGHFQNMGMHLLKQAPSAADPQEHGETLSIGEFANGRGNGFSSWRVSKRGNVALRRQVHRIPIHQPTTDARERAEGHRAIGCCPPYVPDSVLCPSPGKPLVI